MKFQKPVPFNAHRFFSQNSFDIPFTWIHHDDEVELIGDREPTPEEAQDIQDALANYDHSFKLPEELAYEKRVEAREKWLASQLVSKTPAEAHQLALNALQGATTVAEMRSVLETLLPILAASVVLLADGLENEIEPPEMLP